MMNFLWARIRAQKPERHEEEEEEDDDNDDDVYTCALLGLLLLISTVMKLKWFHPLFIVHADFFHYVLFFHNYLVMK